MRCIVPCLRLIYFYMGVDYIVLCILFFLLCFEKLKIEDVSVALHMPC